MNDPVRDKLWADTFAAAKLNPYDGLTPEAQADSAVRLYDQRAALTTPQADKVPAAEGASEPVALPFAIFPEELKALHRFYETTEDGQDYDVPVPKMKKLATIGLVRRVTGNRYEFTDFGLSVCNGDFATPPAKLPQEAQPVTECDLPPVGWRCTRGNGHEGPCAAVEDTRTVSEQPLQWAKGYAVGYKDGVKDVINAIPTEEVAAPKPARAGAVEPSFTIQQIADACQYAEISDGHFQSVLIALESIRKAAATTAATGEKGGA